MLDCPASTNPEGTAVKTAFSDGRFTLECCVSWAALGVPNGQCPFSPGERMPAVVDVKWYPGSDGHYTPAVYRQDPGAFAFMHIEKWGRMEFQPKTENIKGNFVQLPNRIVELNTDVEKVVDKAKKELGYRMNVKQSEEEGKRIAYSYYRYNSESEYFWKNRPNKFNHNGLDSMKPSARKIKINNLISRIGNSDITTTSLTVSYVVDKILETERSLGITLSEGQTKTFIDNLGIKVSLYTTYAIKNSMGK
jgi:hypothetical protein